MRKLLQQALNALEYHTQQTLPIHNTELAIDALREALAAPMPEPWMPIETTPKSNEEFLLISRSGRIRIDTGGFAHHLINAAKVDGDECFLTHWMPLPAPPAAPAPVVPADMVQVPWSPQSAVLDTPVVRCPTCYGDDMQTPCAYPEGGQLGCLRGKKLSAAPVVPSQHIIGYVSPRELESGPKHGSTVDVYREQMAGWVPVYAAPVVREPQSREQQIAIREAHCNTASDEYFGARPQVDDTTKRRIYEAGFKEGWESGIGGGNG